MQPRLDLYWIPLGAGTRVVRISGMFYEALIALIQRRPRRSLYHAALIATTDTGRTTVEVAPIPDNHGRRDRGVVAEGIVGSRLLGRFRVFRYEVRCWPDGTIPDLAYAVDGPVELTVDSATIERVLGVLGSVPTPVWGRDELRTGEMWNSNSVVAWALAKGGLDGAAISPPRDGRAPGWRAGISTATRH